MAKGIRPELGADIRGFFDALDHGWLVKFIGHRVAGRQRWTTRSVIWMQVRLTRQKPGRGRRRE